LATINDVAKKAGVSITTVSHVINDTRFVSQELRNKVNQAIIDVGYFPNQLARGLRSGVTATVGLMIPDNSNPYFAEVAKIIETVGFENGYSVILCNSSGDLKKEAAYIDTLLSHQIDGIILISVNSALESLQKIKARNIPFVVVDRDISLYEGDTVLVNNEMGGYHATKYLLDLGHRKIACIEGSSNVNPSSDRAKGYIRALQLEGIPVRQDYIAIGDFDYQSGEQCFEKLWSLEEKPTAIFACNDMMAIGALKKAKTMGVHIPEDVSLIGFDNIAFTSAVSPALTTISQPIEELSKKAISILINKIQNRGDFHENKRIILNTDLVIRESCLPYKN